jgi:hypothetical protein
VILSARGNFLETELWHLHPCLRSIKKISITTESFNFQDNFYLTTYYEVVCR